jgi:hypothetical protein
MLLAVTPLPSPLTTPPETKTYFITGATACDTVAPNCSKQAEEARAGSCQSIGLQVVKTPIGFERGDRRYAYFTTVTISRSTFQACSLQLNNHFPAAEAFIPSTSANFDVATSGAGTQQRSCELLIKAVWDSRIGPALRSPDYLK